MSDLVSLLGSFRLELLAELGLAALLGGIIGLERELSAKPAGFRTNLLICVGAALLTTLSIDVAGLAEPGQNADPARIAAQIVSGIGFLGAGTIIQARGSVHGLTTAATLWVVAAIGIACGAQEYLEASATTILVLVALWVLGRIETRFLPDRDFALRVEVGPDVDVTRRLERMLTDAGARVETLEIERSETGTVFRVRAVATARVQEGLTSRVAELEGVRKVNRL